MRRLIAMLCTLAVPALAEDFDQAVRDLLGDDPARFRAAIEAFQAAISGVTISAKWAAKSPASRTRRLRPPTSSSIG